MVEVLLVNILLEQEIILRPEQHMASLALIDQKMMVTMRERRGGGMQRRPGNNGSPSGNSNATPGGESPKRPPAAE